MEASGDSTGGRAHVEQIVDVPVPQILEQNVVVIKVVLQEQCQRMRFFTFESVWEGSCGRHAKSVCPFFTFFTSSIACTQNGVK